MLLIDGFVILFFTTALCIIWLIALQIIREYRKNLKDDTKKNKDKSSSE